MDKQTIFNKAVAGLASQGFTRSMSGQPGKGCAYRGADGKKCAIGHLIPDDAVSVDGGIGETKVVEGLGAFGNRDALGALGFGLHLNALLSELQSAHDHAYSNDEDGNEVDDPGAMKRNLIRFAERHNLTIPAELAGATQESEVAE